MGVGDHQIREPGKKMRASGLAALSPRRWPRWHDVAAVSGPTGLGGGDSDSSCNSFLARSACGHRAGASSPTQRSPQGRFRARPPPTTPRAGDGAKSMEVRRNMLTQILFHSLCSGTRISSSSLCAVSFLILLFLFSIDLGTGQRVDEFGPDRSIFCGWRVVGDDAQI